MRYTTLFSIALTSLALAACGGSNEPAQSPDAADSAAKSEEKADKAEEKADKAEDKANDAAKDADKAEKANESK